MAATEHLIDFENGVSTAAVELPVGKYTFVDTSVPGYEDGAVAEFTITPETTDVELHISAVGTLTVTVKDDAENAVTAGKLQLCNESGETKYGAEVDITDGSATFAHVPHSAAGVGFYLSQDGADSGHEPLETPQAVTMIEQAESATIIDARKSVSVNFTMVDPNYSGIAPVTGHLNITG